MARSLEQELDRLVKKSFLIQLTTKEKQNALAMLDVLRLTIQLTPIKKKTMGRQPKNEKTYNQLYYQRTKNMTKEAKKAIADISKKETKERKRVYMKSYIANNKEKMRDKRLKKVYGITSDEYNKMFEEQKGCCKICNDQTTLHVDHCHTTGKVRGLLCRHCNVGIGHFEDNINNLLKAIEYLKQINN